MRHGPSYSLAGITDEMAGHALKLGQSPADRALVASKLPVIPRRTVSAKPVAVAWDLGCPRCNETITAPGGSMYWTREDCVTFADAGKVYECPCGARVRMSAATL